MPHLTVKGLCRGRLLLHAAPHQDHTDQDPVLLPATVQDLLIQDMDPRAVAAPVLETDPAPEIDPRRDRDQDLVLDRQ